LTPEVQKILQLIEEKRYEEAFGINPNATLPEINKAHLILSYKFREYPEVKSAINKVINILSSEKDTEKAERFSNIGTVLIYEEKFQEALTYLNKAVELREDSSDYLKRLICQEKLSETKKTYKARYTDIKSRIVDAVVLSTSLVFSIIFQVIIRFNEGRVGEFIWGLILLTVGIVLFYTKDARKRKQEGGCSVYLLIPGALLFLIYVFHYPLMILTFALIPISYLISHFTFRKTHSFVLGILPPFILYPILMIGWTIATERIPW
jgi:tetratricopeptide (TPR) repeat protein